MNKKQIIALGLTCIVIIMVIGLWRLEYQKYLYEQGKILDYRFPIHKTTMTAREIYALRQDREYLLIKKEEMQYRKNLQLKYGLIIFVVGSLGCLSIYGLKDEK